MNVQAVEKAEPSTQPEVQKGGQNELSGAFDELDLWFDEMCRRWPLPPAFRRGLAGMAWPIDGRTLKTDLVDRDEEYCIRAAVPGMSRDHIDVTIEGNLLTIRGTAESERKSDEKDRYFHRELARGEFVRSLQLPAPVDADRGRATLKDGILEVVVPKAKGANKQSIGID